MLVCSVSLRPRRSAIAAELAELAEALDAPATGNIVFATLVDDPASVGEIVDAYLGEIMLETASADTAVDASIPAVYAAAINEAASAADTSDGTKVTMSSEAAAFLARTSGLDITHTNAYAALIDGLVADGIWAKLDALYILATQNNTTALLNLVSSSYTITQNGGTFTVDRGINGVTGIGPLLDTNFKPSTASSPKHTLNSAHISAWSVIEVGGIDRFIVGGAGNVETDIIARWSDGNAYFRINGGGIAGVTKASSIGFYMATRPNSTTVNGFVNGVSVLNNTSASATAVLTSNIPIGSGLSGTTVAPHQIAAASIGSDLTSNATNFYNRLRTYMTTVGVP